jgi:hypothetical protein
MLQDWFPSFGRGIGVPEWFENHGIYLLRLQEEGFNWPVSSVTSEDSMMPLQTKLCFFLSGDHGQLTSFCRASLS